MSLVDDRLAFLVSELPAEEILKIALHGICNSTTTRKFATGCHAKINPLPQWCASDVLLSADLLPKVFSSLSLRDGCRASGACRTFFQVFAHVVQGRMPKHVETFGPALPCVEAGKEPLRLLNPKGVLALPNRDVLVTASIHGGLCNGILHCTPDLNIKREITHHGETELRYLGGLQCDANTVFAYARGHILSFKISDLSPLRRSVMSDWAQIFAISAEDLYVRTDGNKIAVLDKASLVERSRFGEGIFHHNICAIAVLGERLYVSDDGNYPHARVHIFSLQGDYRRTVNLDDVWSIDRLTAAHGRLFATEFVNPDMEDDIEDESVQERVCADVGKRMLTLSPQLEVLHEFRGEGVPGEHDFDNFDFRGMFTGGMAPRGDNELLVSNFDNHCVHVLTVGE